MFKKIASKLAERFPRLAAFGSWMRRRRKRLIIRFMVVMHIVGALTSIRAIMETRTSQGAIAWAVSLNTFPYLAVPAYWVLGQSKFDGYDLLRESYVDSNDVVKKLLQHLEQNDMLVTPETRRDRSHAKLLENLAKLPFTRHNRVDLLEDGPKTFARIFQEISTAEEYILVQFFILRSDVLGNQLKDALIEKAQNGVDVYVLYDEVGSHDLDSSYIAELRSSSAKIVPFNTTQGERQRFRLNFRNHRKIVVVDGRVALVGGHNVGDEYLGTKALPWRDTHVAMEGPIVIGVQASFVEDWHWATGEIPKLNWIPNKPTGGNTVALCLPTGPADELETCTLFYLDAINSAEERLWIVSPYFVPDEQLMSALQLAALRGVDVRILIPENADQQLVYLSSFSYLEEAEKAGIKIFRYKEGFLHQKVMLVDNRSVAIGTANFDNRSMRLNFEITMVFIDEKFARKVESMLEKDFALSRQVPVTDYTDRSLMFRFSVRLARLLAPVQ
ncbi:MAG: cardiolipin synthase [Pirellulaceae bacterium]